MSSPLLRAAVVVAATFVGLAAAAIACGGEHAAAVPAGAPLAPPSAHPSPDPPPAIPPMLGKEDASAADAAADGGSAAPSLPIATEAGLQP
ncbi:MAG TPA: hypothetical protein VLT33_16330 [Labilithrix sp.]|nr:hypothetical protein [Labilithrix sp.]